jgi:hypothetical protein
VKTTNKAIKYREPHTVLAYLRSITVMAWRKKKVFLTWQIRPIALPNRKWVSAGSAFPDRLKTSLGSMRTGASSEAANRNLKPEDPTRPSSRTKSRSVFGRTVESVFVFVENFLRRNLIFDQTSRRRWGWLGHACFRCGEIISTWLGLGIEVSRGMMVLVENRSSRNIRKWSFGSRPFPNSCSCRYCCCFKGRWFCWRGRNRDPAFRFTSAVNARTVFVVITTGRFEPWRNIWNKKDESIDILLFSRKNSCSKHWNTSPNI